LNVAVRWQVLATNPAVLVDTPQARPHDVVPLSSAEAWRLIQAAQQDRMQARWLVGLALGLRQGETLGLWWEDIDLKAGLLRVRRALQRQRGGGLVFTDPKTQRSKRTLPLPAPQVTEAVLGERAPSRRYARKNWPPVLRVCAVPGWIIRAAVDW
jgi:integrase